MRQPRLPHRKHPRMLRAQPVGPRIMREVGRRRARIILGRRRAVIHSLHRNLRRKSVPVRECRTASPAHSGGGRQRVPSIPLAIGSVREGDVYPSSHAVRTGKRWPVLTLGLSASGRFGFPFSSRHGSAVVMSIHAISGHISPVSGQLPARGQSRLGAVNDRGTQPETRFQSPGSRLIPGGEPAPHEVAAWHAQGG